MSSDGDGAHGHADGTGSDASPDELVKTLLVKRKTLRSKLTRTINRLIEGFQTKKFSQRRLQQEVESLTNTYRECQAVNGDVIDLTDEATEKQRYEDWEATLIDDYYNFIDKSEIYEKALEGTLPSHDGTIVSSVASSHVSSVAGPMLPSRHDGSLDSSLATPMLPSRPDGSLGSSAASPRLIPSRDDALVADRTSCNPVAFDVWIDNLVEFTETSLPSQAKEISIADALYRIEASRDIPTMTFKTFSGSPLDYVEFIDAFRIHIHEKVHLSDDMRMAQLKMHLCGDAERVVVGLGCGGYMYATALKLLKEQFGGKSTIARAFIDRLTRGKVLSGSRDGLREFSLDVINCIAALKRIQFDADINASETLRRIVKRMPDHMIFKWQNAAAAIRARDDTPSISDISDFLRKRVKAVFDPDFGDLVSSYDKRPKQDSGSRPKGVHAAQKEKRPVKCYICSEEHRVHECPTFTSSSVPDRVKLVKEHNLCFSCLVKNHLSKDCRSKRKCDKNGCTRMHHKLLHVDPPRASSATSTLDTDGILPVVRILFRSANGRMKEGNCLIDSGATTNIIRADFAKALGLQGKNEALELAVVGESRLSRKDSRRLKFWISSLEGGEEYMVEAHEMDKTVLSVPPLDKPWLASFAHLADIALSHRAGPVDLILGVQYSHLHAEEEIRQGLPFEPVGKRTKLGWFVIGPDSAVISSSSARSVNLVRKVDANINKLYDLETLGVRAPDCSCPRQAISPNDKRAMEMFESSCVKDDVTKRYTIGLPWKGNPQLLPDNYILTEKRLSSLERSLQKDPTKAEMYCQVIKDYVNNQWAVPMTKEELNNDELPKYYLPHFGVYRSDKPSTPLRIVFDPACLFSGMSLNSYLHKGPNLIGDLLGVLLRFREDLVAFVGDISKMFLQVCLTEKDTYVHRFLWRDMDTTHDPTVYRLTRVTFGDKPSPDMASFVMLKLAKEFKTSHPEASNILERDRYVDDLIHSCPATADALKRMSNLDEILATGSFKIKEWYSSIKKPDDSNEEAVIIAPLGSDNVKTLGVSWNPKTDVIYFKVVDIALAVYTRRSILSKLSMLYDPLGLAAAVTIRAKVAMQEVWKIDGIGWDDHLPDDHAENWKGLFQDLKGLEMIEIPRCVKPSDAVGSPELHVFGDASIKAYGAVAYMRWHTPDGISVCIVSAKARVAPLRQSTIPRLELMAALIASRLAKTISNELRDRLTITLWTDSMIVLHWLASDSTSMKPFVGVRVAEIQSTWDLEQWKFVPTEMNPADDLSRGLRAEEMNGRWVNGPDFLKQSEDKWPQRVQTTSPTEDAEVKKPKPVCVVVRETPIIDVQKFSSWQRLLRVTMLCMKFVYLLKAKIKEPESDPPSQDEAMKYWVSNAQEEFGDWRTQYKDLAPFEDQGIIRVGGRLRKSKLTYDQTHPILIPASSHISTLIMEDVHNKMGHPGAERTLCESRRQFWILRGRNLARKTARHCVICRMLRQNPHITVMADLPAERLRLFAPPFITTGVDLFGPFSLKYGRNKVSKAWGAIFTCATVRAIHLEIVESLSTPSFLQALRRFVARRGWPDTMISDNGTNFVGAEKELAKLLKEGKKQIEEFAVLHQIKWRFITPLSPHQGGFYESLIKQVKGALRIVVGEQNLTWNEMSTIFAEVENLVNSRPLGYSSNDPNDLQPLTPNHFVLGRASASTPQGPFQETKNLHKRFEFVQALINQVWKRFIVEYLPTLMRRAKWRDPGRQLKVGDVVLLVDRHMSRGKWDLGRIVEVFPGDDGIVRNVRVKTKSGEKNRSVQKCCLILENA